MDKKMKSENSSQTVIRKKSALPMWVCAGVWIIAALFFPMYRIVHFFVIAVISIAAAVLAYILDPGYNEYVTAPEIKTGSSDADMLRSQIADTEKQARQLVSLLPVDKAAVASRIEKICVTISKISEDLREDPDDARSCKRLMNYYLPLITKLCSKYAFLVKQSSGDKDEASSLAELCTKIEDAFGDIGEALKKQLDALYANDELDVSTDIDVMNEILRRSGIE